MIPFFRGVAVIERRVMIVGVLGIVFLVLTLILVKFAMYREVTPREIPPFSIDLKPGNTSTIYLWDYVGDTLFERLNVTIVSMCRNLSIELWEQGTTALRGRWLLSYGKNLTLSDLDRYTNPSISMLSNESCRAKVSISYFSVSMPWAFLNIVALVTMIAGSIMIMLAINTFVVLKALELRRKSVQRSST